MSRIMSRSRRSSARMRSAISGSVSRRAVLVMRERYHGAVAMLWSRRMAQDGVFPPREAFRELAQRGNLVRVYRGMLADGGTPVSAYARLGRREGSFLLESVVGGEKWAAYSFIGVDPRALIKWSAGKISVVWRDVDGRAADK